MSRTFISALLRTGCVVATVMFAAAIATATDEKGETAAKGATEQMSSASRPGPTAPENPAAARPPYQRLDRLIGRRVVDVRGEKIGNIEDVVLDGSSDSVSYAVVSYGGFLGFGDKLFAVPWSEFPTHPEKEAYTLPVRKAYLKNAPGFPKEHWPNLADEGWAERIRTFYRQGRQAPASLSQGSSSTEPMKTKAERLPVKYRRATCLIGLPAKDMQGQDLGDLDDIVIDTRTSKVVYGVVILNTTVLALDRELAVVPWNAVEIVPELGALRLDADESMLEAVAFTRGEEFPYLGDPLYAQGVERQFEATPYWETLGYVPGEGPMAARTSPTETPKNTDVSVWRPSSEYNQRFDPALVTTVRGTIESIGVFKVERNAVEGLRLRIKTAEGKTWTVYAGPRPFIDNQDITLHFGDEVTVTGAPTRLSWRGTVVMASTIEAGDATCRLRDANGVPLWNADTLVGGGSAGM